MDQAAPINRARTVNSGSTAFRRVLAVGLALLAFSSLAHAFQMNSGYYVGNAQARSITGVGFRPDLVIIKADTAYRPIWTTSAMTPGYAANFDANNPIFTGALTSLDNDGFSLGSGSGDGLSVNASGVRYTWVAFSGSGGGDFKVGSYSGDGNAEQDVTSVGFQPDLVWVKDGSATNNNYTLFRTSSMAADSTEYFRNFSPVADRIKSFLADGFKVGGGTDVNASGRTYYYVAFKSGADSFAVGSYEGDSTDDRNITSVGFQPDLVLVKSSTVAAQSYAVMRNNRNNGDDSHLVYTAANSTNEIQAFLANGFQVGTGQNNYQVNLTGQTYHYFAFKGVSAPSLTGNYRYKTGSYVGNSSSQTISGLGFKPDLVVIKSDLANQAIFTTSLMPADYSLYLTAGTSLINQGTITSLTDDGFSVGGHPTVNTGTPATTYRWYAFGGAPCPEFVIGAYTGINCGDREIANVGIIPDLLVVKNLNNPAVLKTSVMTAETAYLTINLPDALDIVQSLGNGSFEVGSRDEANRNNVIHHYFAFKERSGWFNVGSYTGSGVAKTIPGLSGKPKWIWVKASNTEDPVHRGTELTGDNSQFFRNVANATNRITALNPTSFAVGTDPDVNSNGVNYWYAAWLSAPTSLEYAVEPTGTEVNSPITPPVVVRIVDQFGNLVDYDSSTSVTLSLFVNPGGATLSGTVSATVSGGVATFEGLSLDKVGTGYVMRAVAGGLTTAYSHPFNVGPGQGNKLAFIAQPGTTSAGSIITPAVRVAVKDSLGNIVTTDNTSQITVALANNPSGATLAGTLTLTASAGVSSFDDLSIDLRGSGYRLSAAAPYFTGATSEAFNITAESIAPTVVSFTPSADAVVTRESRVEIIFSEAMDQASVPGAFSWAAVRNNLGQTIDQPVSGTAAWPSTEVFRYVPEATLEANYTYRVTLSTEARDLVGNRLADGLDYRFSVLASTGSNNTFVGADGRTKATLPAGALSVPFQVRIGVSPESDPLFVDPAKISDADAKLAAEGDAHKFILAGSAREFAALDQDGARLTGNFNSPATVIIPYADADGDGIVDGTSPPVRETSLVLCRLDESNGLWVRVPGSSVNTVDNYVYAPVGGFSVYSILAAPATALTGAYAYPNPFIPADGPTAITFTNLASVCTIKIFTLTGQPVRTINESSGTGQYVWDVSNDGGEPLASGVYIFHIKSAADQKSGKLVIIR